jgi:molybdopterin-guanine dinucleotide biosynthesis protein A
MNLLKGLTGIVMCGGKSTRMGKDKGLLLKDNRTWAELAYGKFLEIGLPVKISINNSQKELYSKLFNETDLIEDYVRVPGPLAGLLSVNGKMPGEDILLLACDLTDISESTMNELIDIYLKKKDTFDFFVFINDHELEPLFGIYTDRGLRIVWQLIEEGKIDKFSMKHILETGKTFATPLRAEQQMEFKNYNERKDL